MLVNMCPLGHTVLLSPETEQKGFPSKIREKSDAVFIDFILLKR